MSEPDVVGALDRWLWAHDYDGPIRHEVVQRARDEIVALRATKVLPGWTYAIRQTRDEALEEAAQACTDQTSDDPPPGTYNDACEDCACAIRALKEKGDS